MDTLGGRRVLRLPRCGGIPHRLAGMGPPNVGDCDANHEISSREWRSRGCRAAARPSGMTTTFTQPYHSVCNPCQRGLLSHTPHDRTEPGVARHIHRCASLRAVFVVGIGRRRARRCGAEGDRDCVDRWYLDDGDRCLGSEMAQQRRLECVTRRLTPDSFRYQQIYRSICAARRLQPKRVKIKQIGRYISCYLVQSVHASHSRQDKAARAS
jgi:hypothetical protein